MKRSETGSGESDAPSSRGYIEDKAVDADNSTSKFLPWVHNIEETIEEYGTNVEDGLSDEQVTKLRQTYGDNLLDASSGVSVVKVLISQTCNAMILVLLVATIISLAIRDWISGGVIAGVVAINVVVGFCQEYSAEKTMESLRSMSSPTAKAVRNGETKTVASQELVPGDVVHLNTGDTVPADLRLVDGMNFETEEALLTGESLPIVKEYSITVEPDSPVGDRVNMAFSSCTVSKGRARGIVTHTGMATEIGQIALSLQDKKSKVRQVPRDDDGNARKRDYARAYGGTVKDIIGNFLGVNVGTPLHRTMGRLAIYLFFVAVVAAIVAMAAQKFNVTREVGVYAIVVAISMIPASMVVVLTITMAMGTKSMVARNVVVRKLDSLEALGAVNDICSDKTGTLTQGKMIVRKVWVPSCTELHVLEATDPFNPNVGRTETDDGQVVTTVDESRVQLTRFMYSAAMANIATIHEHEANVWKGSGDPTEIAIQVFVSRLGWQRQNWEINDKNSGTNTKPFLDHLAEFPFDSSIKRMSAIYRHINTDDVHIYTKGAVERILDLCDTWYGLEPTTEPKLVPFSKEDHETVFNKVNELAALGLRVLAFSHRSVESKSEEANLSDPWNKRERADIERNLTFLGLVGIYDPPRLESAPAVKLAHKAGINVHMLTGDHPSTATAIAKEVGILPQQLDRFSPEVVRAMAMTAQQFDALSDEEIDNLPVLPLVVARCAPQTKVRMIEALHRRKAFTAMTGDGVNDSPSLKKANVGIAMGQAGSDVAKDASDIILSDDNFASILAAVEEGRRMTDNIQKFVLHLLAGNVGCVFYLLIGLAFKDSDGFSVFPMSPVELLWIIMATSSFPAMGLGMEHAEPDIMKKPPKDPRSAVFTWGVILDMMVYGTTMGIIHVVSFVGIVYGQGGQERLGHGCNESYNESCSLVYKTRAVTFVQMTWCMLILAWEMIDMNRSLFRLTPDADNHFKQLFRNLWRNQLLFWSVILASASVFPVIYIPVINDKVFKHKPMTWHWGVAVGGTIVFIFAAEGWKWAKRIYYRRNAKYYSVQNPEDALGDQTFSRFNSAYTGVSEA